jgi:hypothetical protein
MGATISTVDDADALLRSVLQRIRDFDKILPPPASACSVCAGKGFTVTERVMAPNVIQRMQTKCPHCPLQQPVDSNYQLVLDIVKWKRTHSEAEFALVNSVFNAHFDREEVEELTRILQGLKLV